jgi:hypothetical protein
MKAIRQRADELHAEGMTRLRTYRVLRREFPHAERDTLVDASKLPGHRTGYMSFSVQIGGFLLSPVTTKRKPQPSTGGGAPR